MAHIITLTGPAHCGKSTISHMFMKFKGDRFNPVAVQKYTTRVPRKNDDDVICVEKIPLQCDLVYEQYGVRYGVELKNLYDKLEEGYTPIIVINDIRAVEDLKAVLGSLVYSIFLYRKPAVYKEFFDEENERATETATKDYIEKNARTRYEKAQAIYRIYIENIQLFDKVILNTSKKEDTLFQVECIVKSLQCQSKGLKEVHMNV